MIRKAMIVTGVFFFITGSYAMADASAGEALFNGDGKCKNCHRTNDKKKVGPGLQGITERASEEWLRAWLKDPPAVWNANDEYTAKLKKEMKKENKPKPTHKTKELSDKEIDDLMDYLKTL